MAKKQVNKAPRDTLPVLYARWIRAPGRLEEGILLAKMAFIIGVAAQQGDGEALSWALRKVNSSDGRPGWLAWIKQGILEAWPEDKLDILAIFLQDPKVPEAYKDVIKSRLAAARAPQGREDDS